MFKKIATSLPFQLILSIITAFILGSYLNQEAVSLFYTLSTCFIDFLLFILPFMVFGFIFVATSIEAKQNSIRLLLLIFIGVFVSNLFALYTSYFFSLLILPYSEINSSTDFLISFNSTVMPLFKLNFPFMIGTDVAMAAAIGLGLFLRENGKKSNVKAVVHRSIRAINRAILWILHNLVIPLLPVYVFGFCLKLSFDKALPILFNSYGKVFIYSLLLLITYIFGLYLLSSGGNLRQALTKIKTMFPALLTGFSTMSSAATLPVTLKCTEKNTGDRNLTQLVLPTTSNIHMLGDDLTIVMSAMALLAIFGLPFPDFYSFTIFAAAFCVAKLSCVGIPGASVLVVLPVVQHYLNFSPEMIAVLTTIYILQDPIGTAANVMGNGAFTLLIQRFAARFKKHPLQEIEEETAAIKLMD